MDTPNKHNENLHFHPGPEAIMGKIDEIKSFYGREDISINEKRLVLEALRNDYEAIEEVSRIAGMLSNFIEVVLQNLGEIPVIEEEKAKAAADD